MAKLLKNLLKFPSSKKKGDLMSCVLCMVLVILASQSRVFDFLIDTNLGRMGLLVLLLTICCTNQIFGVASVLFLVLAFGVHMNSREGMCGKKHKKEGMCGKKHKKEGMCGKKHKKKEAFGNMSKEDRLAEERTLQKGQQPYKEVVERSKACGAKPHDNLETEFGSAI